MKAITLASRSSISRALLHSLGLVLRDNHDAVFAVVDDIAWLHYHSGALHVAVARNVT
jgi:hypothetical protein